MEDSLKSPSSMSKKGTFDMGPPGPAGLTPTFGFDGT
jgi:hypothetical protein